MPWTIMASAFILGFAIWAPVFCVPPMEHILREQLLLTHAQTSLLFTVPILMVAAVAIPAGILADRIGAKKAAGIGAIIVVVGAILRSTATDASSLLAFTFIYGIGLGWCFPNLPKLVSAWVSREKAGLATGIFTMGILSGGALALAITMHFIFPITGTFQGVFRIWSIPPIVAAGLWWILVKEPPRSGISDESAVKGSFRFHRVLRNKNLWLVAGLFLLHNFFFYSWTGWVPELMRLKGATASLAGVITSISMWAGAPALFFMPRLAYKLGVRKPFLWIPGIVLALAALSVIHVTIPVSWLLMALVGVANVTRFTTILALPVEMMPREDVGVASGIVLSLGYTGGVLGTLVGGYILDITGSLDHSFLVLAGLSVVAVGIALKVPETGPKARNQPQ